MADGGDAPGTRIAVGVALGDGTLAGLIRAALARDAAYAHAADGADIVVADRDHLRGITAAVVLIGAPDREPLPAVVKATLPADAGPRLVLAAIEVVAAGLTVVAEHADAAVDADSAGQIEDGVPSLTPRERQVLQLLADGASNKLIARRLGVSVHTAKFHVASLTRKLGATGRLEAVGIGLRLGLAMV